ncbi:MAG: FprA family A-type flavoprotein [Clostridia bacterium]|nr:FprA family A-type flavoprotein [Clostridia bacterium]
MYCVRKVADDIFWVGGSDRRINLFENIFPVPRGVSYNSYLIMDEKTVLMDTVDYAISREFIENLTYVLNGRSLDYIVVNHMEPDHCAVIGDLILRYPDVKLIGNAKTFQMVNQFFEGMSYESVTVKEGDTFNTGKHNLNFVMAPMVHWPEAMVTFDDVSGILFSADAFGTFGALDGTIFADEVDFDRDWLDDARRYYTNIVGKYGAQVQTLLKKAAALDIKIICPLHGPIWRENLGYIIDKYNKWSKYEPENKGVMIAYASMYGNTENMANVLANTLAEKGVNNIRVYDVSNTHISQLISESFKYSHIVLASPTYNGGVYPIMENFIADMKALNIQNRTVAVMDNGTWAVTAGKQIVKEISEMKNMTVIEKVFSVKSAIANSQISEFEEFADMIIEALN